MKMDGGRAAMAIAFASLVAGPGLLLGFTVEAVIQRDFGDGGLSDLADLTFLWLIAWVIFLGVLASVIPNAIMVFGLGLLGNSQGWARSYLVWILVGSAFGFLVAWRMSASTLSISPSVVIAGVLCGLVARLCMRWRANAAPAETAPVTDEPPVTEQAPAA